jgi:hypothetical protein
VKAAATSRAQGSGDWLGIGLAGGGERRALSGGSLFPWEELLFFFS